MELCVERFIKDLLNNYYLIFIYTLFSLISNSINLTCSLKSNNVGVSKNNVSKEKNCKINIIWKKFHFEYCKKSRIKKEIKGRKS